jgi:hypothetical protein
VEVQQNRLVLVRLLAGVAATDLGRLGCQAKPGECSLLVSKEILDRGLV